jgi:hypothetical protein
MKSSQRVAINYEGGCGGHFIHYFLLASEKYSADYIIHNVKVKISAGDLKRIKQQFYIQFDKSKKWLDRELWPINYEHNKDASKLLLLCNQKAPDPNNINICPFIRDRRDWFRTILYKRTHIFRGKQINLSLVKEQYKSMMKEKTFNTMIQGCDYYFEITDFVNNLSARTNLCKFLNIPHNDLMEEFVTHYNNCHKDLSRKTSW